ncbi:MAG: thiamine S protein [Firmicutes bacterium]|nr:thiamine S protein [Bacillota bacterium]
MQLEVRLFATLREAAPQGAIVGVFPATLPDGGTVGELLKEIGISAEKVHMRMVNGVGVTDDYILKENDRVGLFPPVGGG